MTKLRKRLIITLFIIIGLVILFIWQNNVVSITKYEHINSKLPKSFNNYKVLHISDLHNKNYHGRLWDKIKKTNPDIIVITGDLIDRRNTKIHIATEFVQEISKIAPTYYVSGNHEQLSGRYTELKEEIEKLNIQIIDNSYVALNKGSDEIGLMGIADPSIIQSEDTYLKSDSSKYIKDSISKLYENIDTNFNMLLSHRPEQFSVYKDMNMDLVFSGHAHGGQVRIPFIGGLVAPNQGLFPKYTQGIYSDGSTSMVVSRGLGNSIFPLRVFNSPELVIVTLKSK